MTDQPLFSILITTFNRRDELARCLTSLENQTYKNIEVFVYDDGSLDGTKDWMDIEKEKYNKLFIRFEYQWHENWGGPARGRNVGLNWAEGVWCSFLDSDDWWSRSRVEVLSKNFDDNDVIYHELQYVNKEGNLNRITNGRKLKGNIYKDLLMNGNCLSNSATAFKTNLARQAGGVSEDHLLKAVEDYDLWLRLAQLTNKFKHISEPLGSYWVGEDNISTASQTYIERITYLVHKHLNNLDEKEKNEALIRLDYIVARNLQAMNIKERRGEAREKFKRVFSQSRNFMLRVKSLYCYLRV